VTGGKKMDIFQKVDMLKELIKKNVGKIEPDEFYVIIEKLGNRWHYKNKRKDGLTLTDKETAIYELMLNNNINPSTAYKWLLVINSPPDILHKVRTGLIGLREALKSRKIYRGVGSNAERDLIRNIRDSFERYLIR
jgi:hypothetical protein